MLKRIWHLAAVLGTSAGLAFGAITLAQAGSTHRASTESSKESTAPENSARDPDNVQYTAPGDPDYHGAKSAAHVQRHRSGAARHHGSRARRVGRSRHSTARNSTDPNGNDPGGPAESTGEQETSTEAEQGQPGEPANGHQDPPGQDVNHECTGNCVE